MLTLINYPLQWFCKRDENGQMFFYEEGQGLLGVTELPAFDDVGGSLSHKDKMRVSFEKKFFL